MHNVLLTFFCSAALSLATRSSSAFFFSALFFSATSDCSGFSNCSIYARQNQNTYVLLLDLLCNERLHVSPALAQLVLGLWPQLELGRREVVHDRKHEPDEFDRLAGVGRRRRLECEDEVPRLLGELDVVGFGRLEWQVGYLNEVR